VRQEIVEFAHHRPPPPKIGWMGPVEHLHTVLDEQRVVVRIGDVRMARDFHRIGRLGRASVATAGLNSRSITPAIVLTFLKAWVSPNVCSCKMYVSPKTANLSHSIVTQVTTPMFTRILAA